MEVGEVATNNRTKLRSEVVQELAVQHLEIASDSYRRAKRGRAYTAYSAYQHGLSAARIAAVYNVSESTVRNLISEHQRAIDNGSL